MPLMVVSRSRLAALAIVMIAAAVPLRVHAQGLEERAELERFRDSLATTADSMGLLAL
jgi:hypothetical protein